MAIITLHDTLAALFNHLQHEDDGIGAAMAEEAIQLLDGLKWISVNDRLPTIEDDYLVFSKLGHHVMYFWKAWNQFHGDGPLNHSDISHWMPLPQPPKTTDQ